MKNIALASALTLDSVSAFANSFQTLFFHDGIMDVVFQEEFNSIEMQNLPVIIIDNIKRKYTNANIIKAYKNELNEYKLDLRLGKEKCIVYTDHKGYLINK